MDKTSLLRVLGELGIHGIVNERRGWIDFSCPVAEWTHARGTDRHPSAGITINNAGVSGWHCYSCKQKGTLHGLVGQLAFRRNIDYRPLLDRIREVEDSAGMLPDYADFDAVESSWPDGTPLNSAVYDGMWPTAWSDEYARKYLEARGIGKPAATKMDLMWDDSEQRIVFPIRDRENALWGFSGRGIYDAVEPKVRDYYELPKRKLILGCEAWIPGRKTLIVEGLFAYAHLINLGIDTGCNIGALLGSEMTTHKADILRLNDGPVYLLLDNDEAGDAGIFGRIQIDNTRRDGAVVQLQEHIPVFVPVWPTWETGGIHYGGHHGPGDAKTDPDQLTVDEIDSILSDTSLYGFEKMS